MVEERIKWPGWETVRLIGRGSFGAVYEIERDMLGEREKAALKVITIPQSSSDIDELYGEGYDDESITSTFQSHLKSIVAEYSLMRKLNGCTNVVNCDDVRYVQHDDGFGWDIFIKMELLTPLTKSLGKEAAEEQVIRIGTDIARALVLCKRHNIIHRDIKPANIFVSENGDYKLGDFGIAKTVEKTSGGTKIGTYEYMAPEVYHDQPYGSTADIYSLGMVLYWLLNERRTPFLKLPPALPTNTEKEQARKRRFSGESIPAPVHGSDELKRIVLKACAYDPKDRYQSADEMLQDLEALRHPGAAALRAVADLASEPYQEDEATVGSFSMTAEPTVQAEELPAEDEATVSVLRPYAPQHEKQYEESTVSVKIAEPVKTPEPDEDRTVSAFRVPAPEPAKPVVSAPKPAERDDEATAGVFKTPIPASTAAPTTDKERASEPVSASVKERPQPDQPAPAAPKKGKKGLIFGAIGAVAVVAVLLAVLLGGGSGGGTATTYNTTNSVATTSSTAKPTVMDNPTAEPATSVTQKQTGTVCTFEEPIYDRDAENFFSDYTYSASEDGDQFVITVRFGINFANYVADKYPNYTGKIFVQRILDDGEIDLNYEYECDYAQSPPETITVRIDKNETGLYNINIEEFDDHVLVAMIALVFYIE